ncbi:MAG: hypothetical protein ACREBR_05015 [bacterium]
MNLELSQVLSVYSGINGRCCCGCAGKHFYASAQVQEAGKSRGYEVAPEEVSDKMIKKVYNILKTAVDVETGDNNFSTVVGNRLYVVYFR